MKVFHLFANHKFTGPADPALVLARALLDQGVDLTFFPGQPKDRSSSGVEGLARERGLPVNTELELSKHGRPVALLRDVARFRSIVERERPDLVHTHTPNDHLVATLGLRRSTLPVVRTSYEASAPRGFRARTTFRAVSRVWVFSGAARQSFERWPRVLERVRRAEPVLDLHRFPGGRDPSTRKGWEISDDAVVIGVVARMQTHRLFPELIAGFERAARERPDLHLVILGRGTNQETVAKQPARATSVADRIHFPGYVDPADYPRALGAFDGLVFLVPGSDGTCRAAREALVSGVPVIASQRGLLPAIVPSGECGLQLRDETPEAIAESIARLHDDRELRTRLADGATRTRERFDAIRQAELIRDDYRQLIEAAR